MKKMREREIFGCAEKLAVPELAVKIEEEEDRSRLSSAILHFYLATAHAGNAANTSSRQGDLLVLQAGCCVQRRSASSNPKNGHWLTELLPSPLD